MIFKIYWISSWFYLNNNTFLADKKIISPSKENYAKKDKLIFLSSTLFIFWCEMDKMHVAWYYLFDQLQTKSPICKFYSDTCADNLEQTKRKVPQNQNRFPIVLNSLFHISWISLQKIPLFSQNWRRFQQEFFYNVISFI